MSDLFLFTSHEKKKAKCAFNGIVAYTTDNMNDAYAFHDYSNTEVYAVCINDKGLLYNPYDGSERLTRPGECVRMRYVDGETFVAYVMFLSTRNETKLTYANQCAKKVSKTTFYRKDYESNN